MTPLDLCLIKITAKRRIIVWWVTFIFPKLICFPQKAITTNQEANLRDEDDQGRQKSLTLNLEKRSSLFRWRKFLKNLLLQWKIFVVDFLSCSEASNSNASETLKILRCNGNWFCSNEFFKQPQTFCQATESKRISSVKSFNDESQRNIECQERR